MFPPLNTLITALRQRRIQRTLFALSLVVASCRSTTDLPDHGPSSSPPPPTDLLMSAQTFSPDCPQPSQTLSPGPTVHVTDRNGLPQSGIAVRFETLAGQVERAAVLTGVDGTASAGSWTLPDSAGLGILIARIPGGPSVTFAVTSKAPSQVIAHYDLVAIGGQSLPITYPGAGTVTGGHYLLAADGTYAFQYERDGEPGPQTVRLCSNAPYVAGASTFDFYLAPGSYPLSTFYQQRNGHFATASVSGRAMLVKYEDTIDFADERYELESGFDPIVFPARARSR